MGVRLKQICSLNREPHPNRLASPQEGIPGAEKASSIPKILTCCRRNNNGELPVITCLNINHLWADHFQPGSRARFPRAPSGEPTMKEVGSQLPDSRMPGSYGDSGSLGDPSDQRIVSGKWSSALAKGIATNLTLRVRPSFIETQDYLISIHSVSLLDLQSSDARGLRSTL